MDYLVRHTECALIPGTTKLALTKQGIEQAATIGRFFSHPDRHPNLVVASAALRCIQTAEQIMHVLDYVPQMVWELILDEANYADYAQMSPQASPAKLHHTMGRDAVAAIRQHRIAADGGSILFVVHTKT